MKKDVGLLMAFKNNENKGDVELTLSQKQQHAHYVGIAVIYLSVFRLLLLFL